MDLPADKFVERLIEEGGDVPSDVVKLSYEDLHLPPWYDREKYQQGCKFYNRNRFSITAGWFFGLIALLSMPVVLRIYVSTKRSSSPYTAYKRYMATLLHTLAWFQYELKPGSKSWNSLYKVRSYHFNATLASKPRGLGVVNQRDMAMVLHTMACYPLLKPDKLGVRESREGDFEAYLHVWRTIGYMAGLQDRFNIFSGDLDTSRQICLKLQREVVAPALDNVPEYFEYMVRAMLSGMWLVSFISDTSTLHFCKYLSDVPGFVFTEQERLEFVGKLKEHLGGQSLDTGVDSTKLLGKISVKGLPEDTPPRLHFIRDYETLETTPLYKSLTFYERFRINLNFFLFFIATTNLGRFILNWYLTISLFIAEHFPIFAFIKYGIKQSYVDINHMTPQDNAKPATNNEFYKSKGVLL